MPSPSTSPLAREGRPMGTSVLFRARTALLRHHTLAHAFRGSRHIAHSSHYPFNAAATDLAAAPGGVHPSSLSPPPPPVPGDHQPLWTDEVWASPLDVRRRIFCNRSINMKTIRAVGFDLDYTLASYIPSTFEALAHTATVDKLIRFFGYPDSLKELTFDWRYMARGLVIDKRRGNILKVDRHKYVKLAFHGFTPLPREERMATYNNAGQRHEFDEPDFAMIDTLFSLAEAHLFMQLVEMQDVDPGALPPGKTYADLYRDVRGAVDLCHRDGSIKREVARCPERYILPDPGLVPVLESLRASGKKVFLATNSLWDYTSVVMNWLIGGKVGSDQRDDAWLSHFDVVVTGCGKPRFFTERKDLFEVHPPTGMLWNTEGGSPMVPIGEDDLPSPLLGSTAPDIGAAGGQAETAAAAAAGHPHPRARVFQGGSYFDLHKMLGVRSGAEVLYVGDHVYSDLLRGRKGANWRTMLVIPELESELETLGACGSNMAELSVLRQQRDALDDQIQRLEWRLGPGAAAFTAMEAAAEAADADEECVAGAAAVEEAQAAAEARAAAQNGNGNGAGSSSNGSSPHAATASMSSEDESSVGELLANLREQRDVLRSRHRALLQAHHEAFHPVWGQLFKTGYQTSRYAHQVERFACLYASHVSNLMFYSPNKSYRGRVESMAHEREPKAVIGGPGAVGGDLLG